MVMKKRNGFTLIELLVSISIIAILTALLTANFVGARQRGRDGQRKANIYNIQSALELYRSDNGIYPLTDAFPQCNSALSLNDTVYMQKVPCDPNSVTTNYTYTSDSGTTYTLVACLENDSDKDRDATRNTACPVASFTRNNP